MKTGIINRARKAAADQLQRAAAKIRPQEFTAEEKADLTAILVLEIEEAARKERKEGADKLNKAIKPVIIKFRSAEDPEAAADPE